MCCRSEPDTSQRCTDASGWYHPNTTNYRRYYTYLSPQQLANTQEIIEKLEPHIRDISYRTYFRKRQMAIDALSSVLWGYSSKESLALLEKFVPEGQ